MWLDHTFCTEAHSSAATIITTFNGKSSINIYVLIFVSIRFLLLTVIEQRFVIWHGRSRYAASSLVTTRSSTPPTCTVVLFRACRNHLLEPFCIAGPLRTRVRLCGNREAYLSEGMKSAENVKISRRQGDAELGEAETAQIGARGFPRSYCRRSCDSEIAAVLHVHQM